MKTVFIAVLLLSGCRTQLLPEETTPTVHVTDAPGGWAAYTVGPKSFLIQAQFDAVVVNWQDAEAQCESNSARLPTSEEWRIVASNGFANMQRPFYREWFRDDDGATGFYWVGDDVMHVGARDAAPIAFRCVLTD